MNLTTEDTENKLIKNSVNSFVSIDQKVFSLRRIHFETKKIRGHRGGGKKISFGSLIFNVFSVVSVVCF